MAVVLRPDREQADVRFSAAYVGPDVETGRMNARLLAPALFGIAELVERSATIAYGVPNAVTVHVDANFRRGSFVFDLVAATAITSTSLLGGLPVDQIDVLLRWIGLVGDDSDSLFGFLRRVGGQKVDRVETTADGQVHLTINGDDARITINQHVFKLANDAQVRDAAAAVAQPLEQPGITEFRSGEGSVPADLVLLPADVPAIRAPLDVETNLAESVAETAVEIIAPSFQQGGKWRVAQGGASFWLSISDPMFLARIEGGEAFAKGDYLIGDVRQRAFSTSKGLDVERDMVRVRAHRRRDQQGHLFGPSA